MAVPARTYELVERFECNLKAYRSGRYNETQIRGDQYFVEVGEPARELTLPPAEPPNMERLMSVAPKYDIDILGPLPDH